MVPRVHELHTDVRVAFRFRLPDYARRCPQVLSLMAVGRQASAGLSDLPTLPSLVRPKVTEGLLASGAD
jgi:hypothetical protein